MYANEIFKLYGLRENNFNQVFPTETKAIAIKSDGAKQNVLTTPDAVSFFGFLGFGTIWLIIFLIFPRLRKMARDRTGNIKHLDPVPCKTCRYFTDSPYIKCAVHPYNALTQRAIDCPDYCVKSSQK